jgi:hypothetical protein
VAVILFTGCVSKNKETVVFPNQTSTPTTITPTLTITLCEKKCNEICYNPIKQSCCFGKILDGNWREESSDGSCNNLNFKSTNIAYEEWYCGGVRYHLNEDISCCNGTTYNDDTSSCNNGQIYQGIHTVTTSINTQSNYPHFTRVDQIQGKWGSSFDGGIFYVTIENDGEQTVWMQVIPTDSDYSRVYITGNIVAIGSGRFQMSFKPAYSTPAKQSGIMIQISKYTWKYDEATGELVSNENDRLTYMGADTSYIF